MRLTKEDRYGHFYTNKANCRNIWSLDGKKLEGEFFENQTLAIDGEAIDKLGQLEDVEEELGIDLMVLFKALKNDKVWVRTLKNNFHRSIECRDGVRIESTFWLNVKNSDGQWIDYRIQDYGKTWALTKEELL